ncbi:CRISPR-associated endoribonuclease Cas6 [Synechocystis sp. PCC 7339]|uniref:CRISPR-associated endoribonuclease Cas6 n=1 Tax=Synechocystis sp. PCC 7339 TaxID=2782213 RepID=UPI001CBF0F7E|nr:CRISPR-associated endoribonuclease Cas6 [Synechocystis sp. PCC 7339]
MGIFDSEQLMGAEIVGLKFQLESMDTITLEPHYMKGLHAWFLHQIQAYDPELSAYLHDGQGEKPFTLSRLMGPMQWRNSHWLLPARQSYEFYLTLLSGPVIEGMVPWFQQLPKSLTLARQSFRLQKLDLFLPAIAYQDLVMGWNSAKKIELSFLSPTSFRRQGNHYPLPDPRNVFQSYLRRWNDFSGYLVEVEPFLDWIQQCVLIDRHWLESVKTTAGKQGQVTGFVGSVAFALSKKAHDQPDYIELYYALGKMAPYCGTGHKTPFGLGQTRWGWRTGTIHQFLPLQVQFQEQALGQRIDQLTELFLAQRKRTGGERALNICHTQAVILARRELGESLLAIAKDLQMPYETAKTYSKRAQKAFKAQAEKS